MRRRSPFLARAPIARRSRLQVTNHVSTSKHSIGNTGTDYRPPSTTHIRRMDVHQGSALGHYPSLLLMDDLFKGGGEQAPQFRLFADDVTQKGKTLADLENHLGQLHQALVPNRVRISRDETVFVFPVGGGGETGWRNPLQWPVIEKS